MSVLFISETKLKSFAVARNVDAEHLLPHILDSQKIFIEQALGTELYDKIAADITADTLTGNYKILVDSYIQDCLVHFATLQAIPFLAYKIENGNIFSKTSESGTALTREELQDYKDSCKNTAEFYLKRLVDYLSNNTSLFPELSTNSGADMRPSKRSYTNNMNLFGSGYCE
jgi:hypothetical protein